MKNDKGYVMVYYSDDVRVCHNGDTILMQGLDLRITGEYGRKIGAVRQSVHDGEHWRITLEDVIKAGIESMFGGESP